ncbi:MAG: hypothetical protein E5X64_28880 [Mesorhizobium sp.]|nr:MAG: hypothetical protein E5X64_28880 [Mesorhizobium sp.]
MSEVSLGGHVLTGVPQTFTDATGSLTASYVYDPATGIGTISCSYTLIDNTSGDATSVNLPVAVTDADGDPAAPGHQHRRRRADGDCRHGQHRGGSVRPRDG